MKQFEELYSFVSNNGKLTLEQFIKLALHEEANKFFVSVIREVTWAAWRKNEQVRAEKCHFFAAELW